MGMEPCFRSPGLLGTERDMPAAVAAPLVSPFAETFKETQLTLADHNLV